MSFVQRALGFKFILGTGTAGGTGSQTITAPSGLWATVDIKRGAVPSMNEANISIFGLQLDTMNQLSRIGILPTVVRNNIISVTAGDVGGNMALAFEGGIKESWPDFSSSTDGILRVYALTALLAQMKPVAPVSYAGSTDVATVMGQLAKTMGFTLENNNVSVKVQDPYLPGTAREQALALAEAADIYVTFDDDNGVMAILPRTVSRKGPSPTISPQEDMKGYPTYVGPGQIGLECEYNNQLRMWGNVNVQNSIVKGANGIWRVTSLNHDLSTFPDGPWFSKVTGNSGLTNT